MSLLKRINQTGGQGQGGDRTPSTPVQAPPTRTAIRPDNRDTEALRLLRERVRERLINELDPRATPGNDGEVRREIEEQLNTILAEEGLVLARSDRTLLLEQITAEILGFGPLDTYLADDTVTEIMINGPESVYIERRGKLEKTSTRFESEDHVSRIIDRIVSPLGRRIDESSPMVDARLPDGSRINAIIPPLALKGPTLTIRKFAREPFTVDDLVNFGTLTPEVVDFIRACVVARLNVVISGGTGSGKTTLLNVLSSFIPNDERILTIENAAELQLRQDHVVTLESRPPNIEGRGEVTIRDLVVNSLRMRPDRIVVGEVRAGEALDMLQAMNTGHDGSLTTLHSNSPRDALARLETMVLMAGMDLPLRAVREQVASALDLMIHQDRMKDGTRKVVQVTEVQGMEGDIVVLQDIFAFEQTGIKDGQVQGRLKPTGLRPKFMPRLEQAGQYLPPEIFGLKNWRS